MKRAPAGKDELTGEMIKGNRVVEWIWGLRNMAFDVPEDWRSAMIIPLCKAKGCRMQQL